MSRLWLCDQDDGIRDLYADLVQRALLLTPEELIERLDGGERPSGLVIDDVTLLALAPDLQRLLLALPRIAVCTSGASEVRPMLDVADTRARIIEKPFSLDDFEGVIGWLIGEAATA